MPIYEYECLECGTRFDKLQRFSEVSVPDCPQGHAQVHRLLSQPTVIFKGSGFYVTDNGRNGKGKSSRNGRGKSSTAADPTGAVSDIEAKAKPSNDKSS
jgi:putative FmdB family regulatory protein